MTVSTNTLDAITFKHVLSHIPEDGIYETRPALKRLNEKCKKTVSAGNKITQTIYTSANPNTGWYAPADAQSFVVQDNVRDAEVLWRYARATGTLLESDILKNSGSREKIVDLLTTAVTQMREDIGTVLETGIFGDGTGSGGTAVTGFRAFLEANAVGSQTGTYGGITKTSSNTWWHNQYLNHNTLYSTASITNAHLNHYINIASGTNMGDAQRKPTVIYTDYPVYETIWNEYKDVQRVYTDKSNASYGVDTFDFRNVPLIVSQGVTAGTGTDSAIYVLNENFIKYCVHPKRDFVMGSWSQLEDAEIITAKMNWMGNIICTNPRFQLYIDNVYTD